jgi:putative transposase
MAIVASDVDLADLPDELIDELLAGARTPEEITGPDGLLQRLTKRLVERAMAAELTEHLVASFGRRNGRGYACNTATPGASGREGAVMRALPRFILGREAGPRP